MIVIDANAREEDKKRVKDKIYDKIKKSIDKNSNHEILLMGNMNAGVGNVTISNIVGEFSEDTINYNRQV